MNARRQEKTTMTNIGLHHAVHTFAASSPSDFVTGNKNLAPMNWTGEISSLRGKVEMAHELFSHGYRFQATF